MKQIFFIFPSPQKQTFSVTILSHIVLNRDPDYELEINVLQFPALSPVLVLLQYHEEPN